MIKRILALILTLCMMIPLAVACSGDGADATDDTTATSQTTTGKPTQGNKDEDKENDKNEQSNKITLPKYEVEQTDLFKDGKLSIDGVDISSFVIVIPTDAKSRYKQFASKLSTWIESVTGTKINVVDDATSPAAHEIIVGNTSRPETAQTGSNFDGQKEYNAIVENGKLAINFSYSTTADVSALNALQRAFANNECNITEGFTNKTISAEEIQPLVIGALRTELKEEGLYVHRSTQPQIDAWQALTTNYNDWTQQNPCAATGIRIEFESDTSYVSLDLSTPPTNMTLLVNNTLLTSGWSGSPWEIPEVYRGQVNRITILLSNLRGTDNWCIKSLGYDGSCKISPCKTDINMLFIGDSITEGHDSGKRPAYTYTYYTSSYFNANAVVQGYGSSQCWTDIIEPTMAEYFTPDVIVVAMGTNDYGSNRGQSAEWFKDRMDAFLDKIEEVYPGVPIIGVTPLRRLNSMNNSLAEYNYDRTCVNNANAGYAQAYEEHGALLVVAGEDILKETEHYADVLHPNSDGFLVYGDALCKAIETEINKIIANKNKD